MTGSGQAKRDVPVLLPLSRTGLNDLYGEEQAASWRFSVFVMNIKAAAFFRDLVAQLSTTSPS